MKGSYHLDYSPPNTVPNSMGEILWPNGAWAVYQINGDQIADRVVRERVNPKGWYEGEVFYRHPWCGYLGMWETLADAMKAIEEAEFVR